MTARRQKAKPKPTINRQLEPPAPSPVREKDEVAIEFGKFLLDLAKLTFGGMFLTAIMDLTTDTDKLISVCGIIIVILAIVGFVYIRRGNKKK